MCQDALVLLDQHNSHKQFEDHSYLVETREIRCYHFE